MQFVKTHDATIPALGFGVFRMSDAEVERVIPAALEAGFRHFDTAQIYQNEAALGKALQTAGVARDDLFLTTKVWVDNYDISRFAASVDESLDKLKTDQVDLLLLHWPADQVPVAAQVDMLNAVKEAGKTQFVGVSNYNIAQMQEAMTRSAAPIITNQVELHPYISQNKLLTAINNSDIVASVYYSMADGAVPQDKLLQQIGAKYGKSAAQVGLRWLVQQGYIALSKTANPARVAENIAIFDFALDASDMTAIAGLVRPNGRLVSPEGLAPVWDV
ncbi:aldo/keto reductase [Ochrobactrum sp. MR28]|nr:aldo/keto reductase [Ochrobactrum sp. MR28]MBX8815605.1 aldo/keto reductase [Ochrobactrum sp. MR31]